MADPVPPYQPLPSTQGPRGGRSGAFWAAIILAIALGFSLLINLALLMAVGATAAAAGGDQVGKREWGEKTIEGSGAAKIAVIEVRGVISGDRGDGMFGPGQSLAERVKSQLEQAQRDDAVKAVVLAIDSPGGEVTASDALHDAVAALRAAGKPVVAHFGALAASGGYYIAAPCDAIVASPTGLTGSIGVIFQVPDLHRLLDEKLGVGLNTMKSGPFKDIGSPSRPMRDDERALLQSLVDEMYTRFVAVVAKGRAGRGPIPAESEAATAAVRVLADGRIYSGEQAVANGLADSNGHIEAAYAKAEELAGIDDARIIRYRHVGGLFSLFDPEAGAQVNVNAGVQVDAELLGGLTRPRLEFRWYPTF
ncbi:MAG TPA: signal peptide peptidase SppA [Planctomycetota bacterium]|nr:signal peptide peptidase SppA [Planctomycetota bacterium]